MNILFINQSEDSRSRETITEVLSPLPITSTIEPRMVIILKHAVQSLLNT